MGHPAQHLTALRSFHAVVEGGGIAAAASALNVTPGAIRHQLRHLERELGQGLILRHRHALALTAAGTSLYETVRRSFQDIAATCRTLQSGDMEGELRVSCAPALAALRLMAVIDAFAQLFPLMNVRLFSSDRIDDTMDVVISYGEQSISGARIAILRDEVYFPVCSPAFAYGQNLLRAEDLGRLTGLHADTGTDWSRVLGAASKRPIRFRQEMFFPNALFSLQAARDGCGVAVGTSILCAGDLRRGALVRLLDLEVPAPNPYFVIQPRHSRPLVADAFVQLLQTQLNTPT